MKEIKLVTAMALMASAIPALAINGPGGTWVGTSELGVLLTNGNTETQTINGKLGFSHERENWKHAINLEALRSKNDNVKSAERYFAKGKSDYTFSPNNYAFASAEYENDKFSGYDFRTTEVLGYGRRILDGKIFKLDAEAGPGARQSKVETTGDTDTEIMVRALTKFQWSITKTANFTETFSADFAQDAKIYKSISELSAQIIGNLAMKASLTIKNISKVPDGIENTDTETAITIVYKF